MKLNNKHRVLSVVLLMLVMMLSFASVVAFADNGNSTNVAKIDNTEYATLADAIKAANNGDTVTLLADITSVGAPVTVPAGVTATLDLNGHTLKVSKYTVKKDQVLVEGHLTLTDSVGTGKVCSDYTGTSGRVVSVSGSGSLQLVGGTITTEGMEKSGTAVYVGGSGSFTLTGGTVYADAKRNNNAVKLTNAKASMEMRGGTITAIPTADSDDDVYAISAAYSPVKISAGTVSGHPAMSVGNGSAITGGVYNGVVMAKAGTITGGTFTDVDVISLAGYVDETVYACEKQADGSYTVAKAEFTAVATITDKNGVVTRYAAATEAFSALKDGDTLKLLADIGTAAEPLPYGIVVTDGDVNVNLNAKTLIIGYDAAAAAAARVPGYAAGVGIVNGGSGLLTVSGNGTVDVSNYTGTDGIAVWARTGSITVQSGTFINKSNEEATVYVGTNDNSSPVLKISGGTYKNIAEGNYKYDESRAPLTFNIYNGKTADALKISGGSFYGNNDPYLGDDQVKGSILATEMTGVRKDVGYYVVANGQTIQLLDANGGAKNFYTDVTKAFAGAADGDTLILLKNTYVSKQLNVTKAITLDLGGKTLTNSYAPSNGGYSLLTHAAVTMKNGTYKSTKASARGIGAVADFTLENATVEAAGLVGLGCSAADATYTVKNSTVIGDYALANFANNANINIENSTITGSTIGIYHNGSNSGLNLNATGSTITAAATGATNGIYVSGSTDTMEAAGAQQVTLTNCTVSGGTAIEVKYTDLTLTDCKVTATGEPNYTQDNNGATTAGFAVVSTDNATGAAMPQPKGKITIQGANGSYKGQVGLASLSTVKTDYADFKDTNYAISGGSFTKEVLPEYCAKGFIPNDNGDGTFGVKEGKYVASIGDTKYETLQAAVDAATNGQTVMLIADVNANITVNASKNITLDLNGQTLNGGTGNTKATITNYGTLTIKDSSAEKTGTIKRDDNGIEGETSYYVIRNLGTMTIEQAIVRNNSGYEKANSSGSMVGSSLICNGDDDASTAVLNITGGKFVQENFIAIKNGSSAILNVTGGTITSNHSAIQNWCVANITGGELNGQLWTDSWDANSTGHTVIGGDAKFNGEIVVDITGSIAPKFEITGGTLDVTNWRITTNASAAGAKPAVSGGTFSSAVPEDYCAEFFKPVQNADGKYTVEKVKTNNVKINFGGTGGSKITVGVDGSISIMNNHTQEFATGELVSLTATAQDNAKFLFWLDSNGRIVSTNATYQFYVDSDISVTAQFYTPAEGKRYVIFIDMNNHVAGYADVAFGSTVTAPDHLTFANRTFDGWYVDGHTNKYDVGASITVTKGDKDPLYVHAKYTATDAQFTIIVNDEVKTYKYGDRVEVTADADTEGHYFIGWYDDGGILLSSKRTYIFTVTREITVTAKYSETMPSPSSPVVNLYVTDRTPDNNLVIVYEVTWDVPDDYVFATAGLILSTNSDNKDKLLLEKVGKNGIVKVSTTLPNNTPNGKYVYTLTLDADTSESTIYARGYMSFSDSDGNITTIYTEVHESVSKKA